MDKRSWITSAFALGALAAFYVGAPSSRGASKAPPLEPVDEPRLEPIVTGAIWDVETPTPWNPVDVPGAGAAPHRRVGVEELPGLDEITGNLTIGPIGPMVYNSLDEHAYDNEGGFNDEGFAEHDRQIRFWDREHFGERWTLGIFNRVLASGRAHVDDTQEARLMYLSDRTRVVFEDQGGGEFRSSHFSGTRLSSTGFPETQSVLTDADGTRYTFSHCTDTRYVDYQFLTRVEDRYGNTVRVVRHRFDCVPEIIVEEDASGEVEHTTVFRWDTDEGDGRPRRLLRVTVNAGADDEVDYELQYEGARLIPRLTGVVVGDPRDVTQQEMFCFYYVIRTSFLQSGHMLRVVEGPVPRSLRQECDESNIVGNYTLYTFDRNGRLRDVQYPNQLGYHVLYTTSGTVEVMQTWPSSPHEHADCCQVERRPDPVTGELRCPENQEDIHAPFCPRKSLNFLTLEIEGEGLGAQVVERRDNYGRWERWTRDARGNPTEHERYDGHTTRFTYEPSHPAGRDLPIVTVDPFGRRTRRAYDEWGRVTMREPGDGSHETIEYVTAPGPFFGTPRRVVTVGNAAWMGPGTNREVTSMREYESSAGASGLTVVERLDGVVHDRLHMSRSGRPLERTDRHGVTQGIDWSGASARIFYRDETTGVAGLLGRVELSESGEVVTALTNGLGERQQVRRDGMRRVEAVEGPTTSVRVAYDERRRIEAVGVERGGATAHQSLTESRSFACTGETSGTSETVSGGFTPGSAHDWSYEPPYACDAPAGSPACELDPVAERCHGMNSLFARYSFCHERREDVATRDGICGCELSANGDGLGNYTAPDPRFRTCLDEGFYR